MRITPFIKPTAQYLFDRRIHAPIMPVDPVCGIELDEKLALAYQHKGKTYYFCCNGCRLIFTKPRWWR